MKLLGKADVHVFVVQENTVTMGAVVAPLLLMENISVELRGATGALIVLRVTQPCPVVNQVAQQAGEQILLRLRLVHAVEAVDQEERVRERHPVALVIGFQDYAHVIQPVFAVYQILQHPL